MKGILRARYTDFTPKPLPDFGEDVLNLPTGAFDGKFLKVMILTFTKLLLLYNRDLLQLNVFVHRINRQETN